FEQQPHLFRCSLLYRVDVQFPNALPQSVTLVAVLHVNRLRQRASVIGRASFACHDATVTTVPLGGAAQGKHSDGGKVWDGWPAGPAPVLLSHCLTASAIHRLSSMASLTFRKVWAYFSVDRDGFVHLRHSAGSGRRPISRWARLDEPQN